MAVSTLTLCYTADYVYNVLKRITRPKGARPMPIPDHLPLRQKIVKTAQTLIERAAISPAHLCNISSAPRRAIRCSSPPAAGSPT